MDRRLYLAIACDTDPDTNPTLRRFTAGDAAGDALWQGIAAGIPALRRRLDQTRFVRSYGQPPISWLLRCDRQTFELYNGEAAWCARRFAGIWEEERSLGSELGWHPHLYRWDATRSAWVACLDHSDDLELLSVCLGQLRQHADVSAVRTGWDYQSNRLLEFFARVGLRVDASAIPGSVQVGDWAHDWAGAPRAPYVPSRADYRRAASTPQDALSLVELPVLVRRLPRPLQAVRFGVRAARQRGSWRGKRTSFESARWQGVLISRHPRAFREAVAQTLSDCAAGRVALPAVLATYFHSGELLDNRALERFVSNLETILQLSVAMGFELQPSTLSTAGAEAALSLR